MGLFDQQQMTKPDISIDSGYQPQVGQGLMGLGQQPKANMPLMRNNFGGAGVNFNIPNGQPQPMPSPQYPTDGQQYVMGSNSDNGGYQESQGFPMQSFFEGPNKGQIPIGFKMVDGEMERIDNYQPQAPTEFVGQLPQYEYPQPVNETGFNQGNPQQPKIYRDSPLPEAKPMQSFFEGPNAGQIPNGFSMINGELVNIRGVPRSDLNTLASIAPNNTQSTTPALNPTPQPPQIFQPQPMQQPMQQQPSNPVNTQTVQPNFMGQTPFGQPQTGQFTSTNPFVQAAQANAQGNLGGALQATAANRINQQTPYGSLSYQQTGTDAQGNPIWSANQQLSPELQQLTQSSLAGLQASQANPMYGINPGDTYSNAIMQRLAPQQSQAREALDAQLANQGIMPGSEACLLYTSPSPRDS